METTTKSEKHLIKEYQAKGYECNFMVVNGQLQETESKTKFTPKQVFVVAEHRFEGMTNPSDMSILYVIEAIGGYKGTLLVAYGPEADTTTGEFFNEIPKENYSTDENILN